jgi:hypothetical protein
MQSAWPSVAGLAAIDLPMFRDARGVLVPVEFEKVVPFSVRRLFWLSEVPAGGVRGGHAHRRCQQFLICMSGLVAVEVFDGDAERIIELGFGQALHIRSGLFSTERFPKEGGLLAVLCDRPYEADDYLFDREAIVKLRNGIIQ